jgi:23S rRNA (adenine2503-C2)-methyltransferase
MHPIEDLLEACWRYAEKRANRFITFEYIMLEGVNDSTAHADELFNLLDGKPAKVNLIPFNPFAGNEFARSASETIRRFQNRLRDRGLVARGDDIDAACGQLAGKVSDRVRKRLGDKKIRMATA